MKVLHVIGDLDTGGVQLDLYKHLKAAPRTGYVPEVVSLSGMGTIGERIASLGIPVHTLAVTRRRPLAALSALIRTVRNVRPDVMNAQMYNAILAVSVVSCFIRGIPVVWGIYHNSFSSRWNKRSTLLAARICAVLSRFVPYRVVFPSEASSNLHATIGFDRKRLVVIPNGFEPAGSPEPHRLAALHTELGIDPAWRLVGMVGRYDPLKDPETLVAAAGLLREKHRDVRFVLCGPGFSDGNTELIGLLERYRVRDLFYLIGERTDVAAVMRMLTLFTLTSRAESFGNVVGEAMSVGCPCVVTDVGACARLVGDTGRSVPPGDAAALAAGWGDLLSLQPETLHELGERARKRISEHFSLEHTTAAYIRVFTDATRTEGKP